MVACACHIPPADSWAVYGGFNLCCCTFYIYFVLMKRLKKLISKVSHDIANGITALLLTVIYIIVIIPYSLFVKEEKGKWHIPDKQTDKLVSTQPW